MSAEMITQRALFALWGRVEWAGAELNGIGNVVFDTQLYKNIAYVGSFGHYSVQPHF